jgi:hypothetical protein
MWESRSDFQRRREGWKSCFWISRLSTGGHFHGLLGLLDPEFPPHRQTECAMKYMPIRIEES